LPQKLVHYLVGDFNGASKESNYIFYNTIECKKELQTDLWKLFDLDRDKKFVYDSKTFNELDIY
jgi:hypothetical protein